MRGDDATRRMGVRKVKEMIEELCREFSKRNGEIRATGLMVAKAKLSEACRGVGAASKPKTRKICFDTRSRDDRRRQSFPPGISVHYFWASSANESLLNAISCHRIGSTAPPPTSLLSLRGHGGNEVARAEIVWA
jgi:hypothetical protein